MQRQVVFYIHQYPAYFSLMRFIISCFQFSKYFYFIIDLKPLQTRSSLAMVLNELLMRNLNGIFKYLNIEWLFIFIKKYRALFIISLRCCIDINLNRFYFTLHLASQSQKCCVTLQLSTVFYSTTWYFLYSWQFDTWQFFTSKSR